MARLFEIFPDDANWGNSHIVNAIHQWGLPGLTCDKCGQTWTSVGLAYPSVDLSGLPEEKLYRELKPVNLKKMEELKTKIKQLVPRDAILRPGTDLGPLKGTAQGTLPDFVWINPWTLLIQAHSLEMLEKYGVRMPLAVPAKIKFRGKNAVELLELQVEPHARLASLASSSSKGIPCTSCGREEITKPKVITIDYSTLPSHVDIFRGKDISTMLLATERFTLAVKELHLRNTLFREVDVVG